MPSDAASSTSTSMAALASPGRLQQQQPSDATGALPLGVPSSSTAAARESEAEASDAELHEAMSDEDDLLATSPTTKSARKARDAPASPPHRKRVRWSTITIHEFGVGLGGSTISERGGPSIGLADKPEFTWTTKVGEMAECSEGIHRFTPEQRTRLLKAVGVTDGIISRYARETSIILKSRRKAIAEGSYESSSEEEEDEEDEETEEEDSDDDIDMCSRKRKASSQHSIYIGHPQFAPLRRPHMIPANYV